MSTVFLFSGQGSQHFHMGRELFDKNDTFRRSMLRLDDVARQTAGVSVTEMLYSDAKRKGDAFDRTLFTHPAIFMVEYALAQTLIDAGLRPDLVLGTSLGSFAAAAVAGFVSAEDALTAVIRQAIALEASCEPGGMTAVLADPALFSEPFLGRFSALAAVNFATHFVISAARTDLAAIEATLRQREIGHQRLPVSFAFHSQWIDEAQTPFAAATRSIRFGQGQLPIVCCDHAAILSELPADFFWNVARRPIRFREATALLEETGPRRYIDVGPGSTLATFLKYGLPKTSTSTVHSILTPFGADQKNLAAVLAATRN